MNTYPLDEKISTYFSNSFILPCVYREFFDDEEFVVEEALRCLASLCRMGLLQKQIIIEIIDKIKPMLLHPSVWVRTGCMSVVVAAAKYLDPVDQYCFLIHSLAPFMEYECIDLNQETILNCIKPPLSQCLFTQGLLIADGCVNKLNQRSGSSSFLQSRNENRNNDFGVSIDRSQLKKPYFSSGELNSNKQLIEKIPSISRTSFFSSTLPQPAAFINDDDTNPLNSSKWGATKSYFQEFSSAIENIQASPEEISQLLLMSEYLCSLSQALSSRRRSIFLSLFFYCSLFFVFIIYILLNRYPFVSLPYIGRETKNGQEISEYESISTTKPIHEIPTTATSLLPPLTPSVQSSSHSDAPHPDRPEKGKPHQSSFHSRQKSISEGSSPPMSTEPAVSSAGTLSQPFLKPSVSNKIETTFFLMPPSSVPNSSLEKSSSKAFDHTINQFSDLSLSLEQWEEYFGHINRFDLISF